MKEFEQLFDTYKKSVFTKDLQAFLSIFHENVLVFDMWQQWTYEGIDAWKEMAAGWFQQLGTDKDVVGFDDINIGHNEDFASITSIVRFTAVNENGEALRFLQNRLTWVVRKKEGVWKIVHQHTSSPVDFETMKPILSIC